MRLTIAICLAYCAPLVVHAQGSNGPSPVTVCDQEKLEMQTALEIFGERIAPAMQEITDNEAQQLQNVVDGLEKPDTPENVGIVHAEFDVTWNTKSLDVPTVTVGSKLQDWIYKIPEVTMKQRDVSWDFVGTKMVNKKTGQIPQETCKWRVTNIGLGVKTKTWACTTTWKDVITKVPEFYRERKKISIDIPEVVMKEAKTSFSLPTITVDSKKVSFNIPEFRMIWPDDARRIQQEETEDQASEYEAAITKASTESQLRITESLSYIRTQSVSEALPFINSFYSCTRNSLKKKRSSYDALYGATIAQHEAILGILESEGAQDSDEAAKIRKAIADTKIRSSEEAKSLEKMVSDLDAQERDLIANLSNKTQHPPTLSLSE